jgi:hypothetical protein
MTAPERFAEKSDSLLHRGRRPYMTHSDLLPPSIGALRKIYSIASTARFVDGHAKTVSAN